MWLVHRVQLLESSGFAPERNSARCLAIQLSEKLDLSHKFNKESGLACYDRLLSFLEEVRKYVLRRPRECPLLEART
jgi:hypothetical protein